VALSILIALFQNINLCEQKGITCFAFACLNSFCKQILHIEGEGDELMLTAALEHQINRGNLLDSLFCRYRACFLK